MNIEIAIIGYGRFGRLIAHHLRKYTSVCVFDKRRINGIEDGIRLVPLRDAVLRPVIIFAVPVGELQNLLRKMRPIVNPNALIIDVCAVKEEPLRWMKLHLPPGVSLLGTHPLFGPSSASKSVLGRTVVLCPARINDRILRGIRRGLLRAGLFVQIMTPAQHDRWIARTLFITQFVGRGLRSVVAKKDLPSEAFRHLRRVITIASEDSPQLVKDIFRYNRHARAIPPAILRKLTSLLPF